MTARQQRPPLAFCVSCNARERAIVAGRCIVCGNPPKAEAHTPTYGPVNSWTWRSDSVVCSCGWSWKRGSHDVCGTRGVWEQHVRREAAR